MEQYKVGEIAKMVDESGKVFAADLQEEMLQKIKNKINGTSLEGIIALIKCEQVKINVPVKVDFILAFYMVHEVPNKDMLFAALKSILHERGELLIVEPKFFHVSQKKFASTIGKAEATGFITTEGPKLPFSFAAILKNA